MENASIPEINKTKRSFRLHKFWKKNSCNITEEDATYRVTYLGNVLTTWAKGDGCVDKPLSILWKNYRQNERSNVRMKLTITCNGLRAGTAEHGVTEYWSNRITFCCSHSQFPKVFCWIYRHEGKKLKQELRCHAVLCSGSSSTTAQKIESTLREKISMAFVEFKRDKIYRQNLRLNWLNNLCSNHEPPRRRLLLCTGSQNYKPPLERSKSAPKLPVIEESPEEENNELKHILFIDDDYAEVSSNVTSEYASDITDFDLQSLESGVETFTSLPVSCESNLHDILIDENSNNSLFVVPSQRIIPFPHILCQPPSPADEKESDSVSNESGFSEEKESCDSYLHGIPFNEQIVFICTL